MAIEPRTKTVKSFAEKTQRPDKQGKYSKIHQMTDLSGIRIVAYYLKDLKLICGLIEDNFEIDRENSTDKTDSLAPDRFGYSSIHYIVSHSKARAQLPENETFAGLKAEIQIRTVLQHAWAALDRKLRYNNEKDIPREVRRKLFRVSALLEIADENFSEVDRLVNDLREKYKTDIQTGNLEQEINLDSLEVFMREAASVKKLVGTARKVYRVVGVDRKNLSDPYILRSVSNLAVAAAYAGIKSIAQLNSAVIKFNVNAKPTLNKLSKLAKSEFFSTAGLIRLAIIYTAPKAACVDILYNAPFIGPFNTIIVSQLILDTDAVHGLKALKALERSKKEITDMDLLNILATLSEERSIVIKLTKSQVQGNRAKRQPNSKAATK